MFQFHLHVQQLQFKVLVLRNDLLMLQLEQSHMEIVVGMEHNVLIMDAQL